MSIKKVMKFTLQIIVSLVMLQNSHSYSQKVEDNYIAYYNYANEGDYYFYEENYDSAVVYYSKALEFADIFYPRHHYNYSRALWKIGNKKRALKELEKDWQYMTLFIEKDTSWFEGMEVKYRRKIEEKMLDQQKRFVDEPVKTFIDSLRKMDQELRRSYSDSIVLARERGDDSSYSKRFFTALRIQDSITGSLIIEYTTMHGFPGGKNANWNQLIATPMLHMPKEWFIKNYELLLNEVRKGNLEPWILAMGIDRMFVIKKSEYENICPYNWYYHDGIEDPFIVFQNSIKIGVSPYFRYYWFINPSRSTYYEIYKADKKVYNTTLY